MAMAEQLTLEVKDPSLLEASDVAQVLKIWEENCDSADFDPTQCLTRLAEIIENEIEQYMKLDPDPFDDRHPCRTHPQCSYGQSLKTLFKKDAFMDKLVHYYMRERWGMNDFAVNTAACRLFIGIIPGLETSAVYQETEDLVTRLLKWAETSPDPLRSYALGLLGASMEVPEVASKFRDNNVHLVPLTLCRLRGLQAEMIAEFERPFAQFSKTTPSADTRTTQRGASAHPNNTTIPANQGEITGNQSKPLSIGTVKHDSTVPTTNPIRPAFPAPITNGTRCNPSSTALGIKRKRNFNLTLTESPMLGRKKSRVDLEEELFISNRNGMQDVFGPLEIETIVHQDTIPKQVPPVSECSSSSWVELESNIIGMMKIYPLTPASKQILSLRYLTPLGEYQEMLSYAFKNNAVELILNYLDTFKTKDSRLMFEALKYLSSLLCHKKFALEFIRKGGLLKMLKIPRPSISATGVSLCLYYIAYAEDAMEKVCMMPKSILTNLVAYVTTHKSQVNNRYYAILTFYSYAVWLLECSHGSGRNHALMFFGASYPFKIMLDLFDAQDGLRVILNIVSTLPNFLADDNDSEENQMLMRQVVRQVGYNLKRYFECHLSFLAEKIEKMQQQTVQASRTEGSYYKQLKHDPAKLRELNNFVLPLMPLWARWHPVEKLIKLGGLQYLMQVIAFAYDWNYSGRGETVKSVLDTLAICCLVPRVQILLTERLTLQGSNNLTYGLSIILSAAEGEVVADPDVQRSALVVIGNCVCGPLTRQGVCLDPFQHPNTISKTPIRKSNVKTCEDLLNKIWECVRVNNGILILTRLLLVKTPIRDADSLRALACWCIAGLARYIPIRQVLEQLPLMKSGLIQMLMRDPVLQENRQQHAVFQKYGLELIKLVYGKITGVEYDLNVVAIQKSDLISQSRIQYNEKQLLELLLDHLVSKGLVETASSLVREAKLDAITPAITLPPTSKGVIGNALPLIPARKGKTSFGFQPLPSAHIKERKVTLDTIVTEYLTNQHSLCKTPMAICPTFDLVIPHKCPTPKAKVSSVNFGARFGRPGFDWSTSGSINRRLVYSKFKPIRVLRSPDEDHFTTASFSSCNQWAIVGTHNGEVKLINIQSGTEDGTYSCHDSEIHHVQPNRKGNLLITSSIWRRPLSKLWRMDTLFDSIMEFDREEYVEFSKLNQDKLIATNMEHANIYDIETQKRIFTLEPRISNQYTKNRATFDPNDELILCDGVLWDFKSGTEIHKFDKLNESISGVFHPMGLEIIANSEVWDMRTFKLLRTVRTLDQCTIVFTNDGEIIYGTKCEKETQEGYKIADTSFVTLDATDYERIGTIELKRNIYSLATSPNDLQIALVENSSSEDSVNDSCVRFYEVGRSRGDEEQADEDYEEDELQSQDSDDDDDDDDGSDDLGLDVDRLLDELLPTENEEFENEDDESQEDTEEDETEMVLDSDSEEPEDEQGEAGQGASGSGLSSSSTSGSDVDF